MKSLSEIGSCINVMCKEEIEEQGQTFRDGYVGVALNNVSHWIEVFRNYVGVWDVEGNCSVEVGCLDTA